MALGFIHVIAHAAHHTTYSSLQTQITKKKKKTNMACALPWGVSRRSSVLRRGEWQVQWTQMEGGLVGLFIGVWTVSEVWMSAEL